MKSKLVGGSIFQAINDVFCPLSDNEKNRVHIQVKKGELCEFRYPHNAHFRVESIDKEGEDIYLYLSENDFLENFKYVGKVFEVIRFRNSNSMKEIISARLWEKEK